MKNLSLILLNLLAIGIGISFAGVNGSKQDAEVNVVPKLCSYNVSQTNTEISLSWRVENNYVVDHFVVEKSTDGVNFTETAVFKVMGDDSDFMKFTYKEMKDANNANVYFRVKQFDNNGVALNYNILSIK